MYVEHLLPLMRRVYLNSFRFVSTLSGAILLLDSAGCTVTVDAGPDVEIIEGQSAQLDGHVDGATASGKHGVWTPTDGLSDPGIFNPEASPTMTTTYTLTVQSGPPPFGRVVSDTLTVTVLQDADRDGIPDALDNCPNEVNPGQEDANHNGAGDACELPTGGGTTGDNTTPGGTTGGSNSGGSGGSQRPPAAEDQSIEVVYATPKAIALVATDADQDPLTFANVELPAHGTLSGTGDVLTYTPNPAYSGPDSFTFKANDGHADSNVATVAINVLEDTSCISWSNRTPSALYRSNHALVYDSLRHVVVLFGGSGPTGTLDDTWEFSSTTHSWAQRTPAGTSPSASGWHSMVYDSARHVTVMFRATDIWEWDGASWSQRVPADGNTPPTRYSQAMSYDSLRGVIVLHGGSGTSGALDDTWEWDGATATWTNRTPATGSPPARAFHAMAYDSERRVSVLFGGYDADIDDFLAADIWEWDGTTWTQKTASGPVARYGHAMAYDSNLHRTIMFGGMSSGSALDSSAWTWNGSAWSQITSSGPAPRLFDALAFNNDNNTLVLFAGLDTNAILGDTWELSGSTWTNSSPVGSPAPAPRARIWPAMAYDKMRGVSVMYGGQGNDGIEWVNFDATWEWNGSAWTQRSPVHNPGAIVGNAMAYDSTRGVSDLVGGGNDRTWEWNGVDWMQFSPTAKPASRSLGAMVYDSMRQATVLFGGFDGTKGFNDTWKWDGANWTQLDPPTKPSERIAPAMAYDSLRQVIVLLGGYDIGSDTYLNDTWEWNGVTWIQVADSAPFDETFGNQMVYDNVHQVMLMLHPSGITWAWDGANWTNRLSGLNGRWGGAMVYDNQRKSTVLFGGVDGGQGFGDTWELRPCP